MAPAPGDSVPHGLMFHRFHSSRSADNWQGALSPEEFEAILLRRGVARFLSPEDWINKLSANALSPEDLCVTFDDGLTSQLDFALPVLEKHGIRAFWFVYSCVFAGRPAKSEVFSWVAGQVGGMETMISRFLRRCPLAILDRLKSAEFREYEQRISRVAPFYSAEDIEYRFVRNDPAISAPVERIMDQLIADEGFVVEEIAERIWMSESDLKRLSDGGHEIGLHSFDHPYELGKLPEAAQRDQYERNSNHLVSVTGRRPISVSHPLNSYSAETLQILAGMGIICGFRANMSAGPTGVVNASALELAREDAVNLHSLSPNATPPREFPPPGA